MHIYHVWTVLFCLIWATIWEQATCVWREECVKETTRATWVSCRGSDWKCMFVCVCVFVHVLLKIFKGTIYPKIKNDVIIYSLSCHSKPFQTFVSTIKNNIFWRVLFWTPLTFIYFVFRFGYEWYIKSKGFSKRGITFPSNSSCYLTSN